MTFRIEFLAQNGQWEPEPEGDDFATEAAALAAIQSLVDTCDRNPDHLRAIETPTLKLYVYQVVDCDRPRLVDTIVGGSNAECEAVFLERWDVNDYQASYTRELRQ